MFVKDQLVGPAIHHHLSWRDLDSIAHGDGGAEIIRELRRVQRSRRLLLLRVLTDEAMKDPRHYGDLADPDVAWDLLAQAQDAAPHEVELILGHPYTGAWLAYTRRLIRGQITSDWPLWTHVGHLHALAAAAAIRAGIHFEARIPVRHGEAILPTLGMARLSADSPWSVAEVRGDQDGVRVTTAKSEVVLPQELSQDTAGWWAMRHLSTQTVEEHRIDIRLDDLDPYRGLHEPDLAERTDSAEVQEWAALLDEAWRLIVECVPSLADGFPVGFDSLVPRPAVPFKYMSGSTSETFGSAVIAKPPNAPLLAAALVHEFQHSRLHALMHLTRLHEPDLSERYYTLWRDDPRPIGGVLHGVYAFFGMTKFWRALAQTDDRRAQFEFAYSRIGTWRTLQELRQDPNLTPVGQRFVDGIAEALTPLHDEPIAPDIAALAEAAATDHHAGWRMRHVRPSTDLVKNLAYTWLSGSTATDEMELSPDPAPDPEPDGSWQGARTELVRLSLADPDHAQLTNRWSAVPGATYADFAYITGNVGAAVSEYTKDLTADPENPSTWVGLGLALRARDPQSLAARALLANPELVRAVHRKVRTDASDFLDPTALATWIAQVVGKARPSTSHRQRVDVAVGAEALDGGDGGGVGFA